MEKRDMKNNNLAAFVRSEGYVPLAWAGSTAGMDYLNIGDALSPVMVALLSGRDVRRRPSKSASLRMACVGTIGHGFSGGEVWFWGTGCSPWINPAARSGERVPFTVPPASDFHVLATRGPVSERLLTGGRRPSGVYGDPVWLLPRFYAPPTEKKWKLGVIVHLSELTDREAEAHIRETLARYRIPDELKQDICLINTVSPIGMQGIKEKIDTILACERIVSTSLHGMVFAESYGIPCLHFATDLRFSGLSEVPLSEHCGLDLRVVDLYRGLGMARVPVYGQPTDRETDWGALIRAIDAAWEPRRLDEDRLVEAFPVDYAPLQAPAGATIWDHPLLTGLALQHDVAELNRLDKEQQAGGAVKTNAPLRLFRSSVRSFIDRVLPRG